MPDDRFREISSAENSAVLWLTPSEQEQTFRILSGLCPHNAGWSYFGHNHNDSAYKCNMCGEIGYY